MKLLPPQAHAYLDGELPEEQRRAFEVQLGANPDLAAALSAERQFRTDLQARAHRVTAPASLRRHVQAALAAAAVPAPSPWRRLPAWWSTPWPVRPVVGLLYTLAWLAILSGVVWWSGRPGPATTFVKLADRHALYFEDTPALDVTGPPEAISAWFQNRLPFPVNPPTPAGLNLVGARLGELNERRAVHILYERTDGQRLSLTLFSPDEDDFPPQYEIRLAGQSFFMGDNGQHGVILWRSGQVGYALVGDIALLPATLQPLAVDLRARLP